MSDDQKYMMSLLEYPEESVTVDYKAAVQFNGKDDFAVKLVRHILGFANSGGGYIIIGFREDGEKKHGPDPNLTSDIIGSYEVTQLSQYVHSFLSKEDTLELTIKKVPFKDGKTYPIIGVVGFKKRPFFCAKQFKSLKTGEIIVDEGAMYIRSLEAKTVRIKDSGEWERLIDRCVAVRREDLAVNFKELLDGYFHSPKNEPPNDAKKWIEIERKIAKEKMAKYGILNGTFEVTLTIPRSSLDLNYKTLLAVAEKAECRNTDWPIGVTMTRPEYKPMPIADGIVATIALDSREGFDYWKLKKTGDFYFIRNLKEDTNEKIPPNQYLFLDIQIWRIGEAILYCSNLCKELDLNCEDVSISIRYDGITGRKLIMSPWTSAELSQERVCVEDSININITRKSEELIPYYKDIVYDAIRELAIMFDFFEPARSMVDQNLERFINSRV